METIDIKRIYDVPSEKDGYRVLVDRLWPRGVSKVIAHVDEWDKDVAPSPDLRKWFDHKEERFEEFSLLYQEELALKESELERLRDISKTQPVTLVYAARNPKVNHAVILKQILLKSI